MLTKLSKKARKLSVAYKYRKSSDKVACFWHLGSPNFGDDLNPFLFESFLHKKVYREAKQSQKHFLGVGSILERANANSIVVGSGFIRPDGEMRQQGAKVLAVRGELTQAKLNMPGLLLGDPGILVPNRLGIVAKPEIEVAVVPHVDFYKPTQQMYGKDFLVVDPSKPFEQVISEIASASAIISQSLHGLVMADALGIPNVWAAPHGKMIGGEFKFMDYYSTAKRSKHSIPFDKVLAEQLWRKEAFVSESKMPLDMYSSLYEEMLASVLPIN